MSTKVQRTAFKKSKLKLQLFFRQYPGMIYLLKWIVISLFIGSLIGTASAGFLISLDWVTDFRESHLWIVAFLPIAGLLIGMLYYYYGKSVESGNNLLIESIHFPKDTIPFKMAPFVYLGTIATHFFGGSAGREGTALQMAGAIADQFSKPFRLSIDDRRILLIAAVAGGFGSVFGTPLAGAIFGMEFFLLGKLRYNAIFPAFLTAIIADITTKSWNAHHTHYEIDFIPDISYINLLYAILAGVLFGICAALFSKLMNKSTKLFKSTISYPPLRPFTAGILIAGAVFLMESSRYIGLGIPVIVESFQEQLPAYDFLLKIIFTVITLSAGFKGGEVTPLFFIGATLGNALALFIPLPLALLAGMGFVAVFAGATNTPIACSIMAIELFGAECSVYVAIACVVSYLLSGNTSIYSKQQIGEPKNKRFSSFIGKRIGDL